MAGGERRGAGAAALLLVVMLGWTASSAAGEISIRDGGAGFALKVTSWREGKFRTVVNQRYDYSCGSAALATLLTFHYGEPVGEAVVFRAMYDKGDQERIRREGFSLLDMKEYLEEHGYRADGYRLPLQRLKEAGVPAIVLIDDRGYHHFVVVKGVGPREVLLGDPAKGLRVMELGEFEKAWNGILFVIRNRQEEAAGAFNSREEWAMMPKVPLAELTRRPGVAPFTLLLLPPHDL